MPENFKDQKIADLQAKISSLELQNNRLSATLSASRERLVTMQKQLENLAGGPAQIARLVKAGPGIAEATVSLAGKNMILPVHPDIKPAQLVPGKQVRISEEMVLVRILEGEGTGQLVTITELLGKNRALIRTSQTETQVVELSAHLTQLGVSAGETVVADLRSGFAWEKIELGEVEQLLAPQVPAVEWDEIGGLQKEIDEIRDAVELPFKHPEVYQQYGLEAPRGILLYGPPGCGKTLIAKAVATALGRQAGEEGKGAGGTVPSLKNTISSSYFLSIKGPELLSKFVGETERQIRAIFRRARELAAEDHPVVIFFDEMEALFRTRGSGISSDVETMIVPQLLAEIDGVDRLGNVIVIGASNREDMIDPAVLRPGRLDVRIRIDRPNLEQARQIFLLHLSPDIPLAQSVTEESADLVPMREDLADRLVEKLGQTTPETALYQVEYRDGNTETIYARTVLSGAMIASIVERAKKLAIKEQLSGNYPGGVAWSHLELAIEDELRQTATLEPSTSVAEWARVLGHRGGEIESVKSAWQGKQSTGGER